MVSPIDKLLLALVGLCAYLLGSVPSAYLVGRVYGVDIRRIGDRNVGAANTLRQVGVLAGTIVAVADIAKGVVSVLLAQALGAGDAGAMLAGLLAVVGHNWPVFLRFRGGRGAATGIGVFLALFPGVTAALFPLGILLFVITHRGTPASIIVFGPQPALYLLRAVAGPLPLLQVIPEQPAHLVLYSAALPLFILLVHIGRSRELRRERERLDPPPRPGAVRRTVP
ncbi:MAG: glycerol-3-phosphate acyltransferase [Chloroflexi bacterium]|nr:glycerol-3-phosphate acyltransferase [Chloroflexota bacterium]